MRLYTLLFSVLLLSLSSGCKVKNRTVVEAVRPVEQTMIPVREHSMQSVLWQQQSAEYRALTYQAYNIAKLRIDNLLADTSYNGKQLAVITDIDETVIDNSPYNAKMIQDDVEYTSEGWVKWGKLEQARAIPGAVDFFNYIASKGVAVHYISNRYDRQFAETKSNLLKLGLPLADDSHLQLRQKSSGKEPRRQSVKGEVVMLLGDNLTDFSDVFENKRTAERADLVDQMREEFGHRFIVFPNPMYGDWETKGLYEGSYKWTSAQKDSIRRSNLRGY